MTEKQRAVLLTKWMLNNAADPEIVRVELEKLRKRGGLTARRVIAAASAPDHPLHSIFEWDDSVAAAKWRELQARELIRSIAYQINDDPPRRAYVHVPKPRSEGFYERTEIVVQHVDMFTLALEEAQRDVAAAQERVNDLLRHSEGQEDRVAIIAMASTAMATAQQALQRLH